MKKTTCITALLLLSACSAFAQNASRLLYNLRGHYVNNVPTVTDSIQYYNSPTQGAAFSFTMAKDVEVTPLGWIVYYTQNPELFPVDSIYYYTTQQPQPLALIQLNSYNSQQQLTRVARGPITPQTGYDNYTYTGNQLTLVENFTWDNLLKQVACWHRFRYGYDAGNLSRLQYENLNNGKWDTLSTTNYFYSNGNLDSAISSGFGNTKIYYTYNPDHSLLSMKTITTSSTTTTIDQVYSYNTGNDPESMTTFMDGNLSAKEEYTYDNAHNCLTMTKYTYSGSTPIPRFKYLLSYNAFNQVTELTTRQWDDQTSQWIIYENSSNINSSSHFNKFVYEEYTRPVSVPVASNSADLELYPSPAGNFIRIDAAWKQPTAFTAAIYDISGHIIQQWTETAVLQYNRTIPTTHLPAGNYFIQLNTGKEKLTRQFTVSH